MKDGKVEYKDLKDGMKVKCRIEGRFVDDARITVDGEKVYVCQNLSSGRQCNDKKGYTDSWYIGHTCLNAPIEIITNGTVTDLRIVSDDALDGSDPANWHEGDIFTDGTGFRMVLLNNGYLFVPTNAALSADGARNTPSGCGYSLEEARIDFKHWHLFHLPEKPAKPTADEQAAALDVLTRAGRIVDGKVVQP